MTSTSFWRKSSAPDRPPLSLRLREAAASLGISPSTLERLTRSGEIASVKIGRCRLYEISTLEKFLESRRHVGQEVAS
jgi:excisionase family DNA binding protein